MVVLSWEFDYGLCNLFFVWRSVRLKNSKKWDIFF